MYKIGDYVVYKRDVCIVRDIKDNYYVLSLIDDDSLIINVPLDNKLGNIRDVISKKDALKIIDEIPSIEVISDVLDKKIEQEYKSLLNMGHIGLIKIIKTTYLRNDNRIKNKKRVSERDNDYFCKAERLLYNELSIALNMSYDDVKKYIYDVVNGRI